MRGLRGLLTILRLSHFVSDVYLPRLFLHFKVACHLHVGRYVVGTATKLLHCKGLYFWNYMQDFTAELW